MVPVVKTPKDYQVYRISSDATNRLAIAFDRASVNVFPTVCVEIFDVGGKQPLNRHQWAMEMFFILHFAELVHSGIEVELDEENLAVLRRT